MATCLCDNRDEHPTSECSRADASSDDRSESDISHEYSAGLILAENRLVAAVVAAASDVGAGVEIVRNPSNGRIVEVCASKYVEVHKIREYPHGRP